MCSPEVTAMQSIWQHSLLSLVLAQMLSLGLPAQTATPPPLLVELFTSEGCSSCPPADALLREINGTRTSSGQLIVGISEHVTYWNSLGWADPFSAAVFTERQNAYGNKFGLDSVYTPQMVVNGAQQVVGSDRNGLARIFKKELDQPIQLQVHILSAKIVGNAVLVRFSTTAEAPNPKGDIVAVLADDTARSSVARGENSGRNLTHVAVARSITRVSMAKSTGEQEVRIPLPSSFRDSEQHHVILFAQAPSHGRVLGVDSASLARLD
jgi:hypothetical protein